MKKHLEKSETLSNLFNKKNIKISYCCINNIKKIIYKQFLKYKMNRIIYKKIYFDATAGINKAYLWTVIAWLKMTYKATVGKNRC